MNQEGTEAERRLVAYQSAAERNRDSERLEEEHLIEKHTPMISELSARTCFDMLKGLYGPCDGQLEVVDVTSEASEFGHAIVQCPECKHEVAMPNPRRKAPEPKPQEEGPRFRGRKTSVKEPEELF